MKIKNRKPTGRRRGNKREVSEELRIINQNLSAEESGGKDYENVGIEIQEKTTKVSFVSISQKSQHQPIVLEKSQEIEILCSSDDENYDKKMPNTVLTDIDQADTGDNSKVSDAANRKVISRNDSVTTSKTNPVDSPSPASSKIPKYINNNKLKISVKTVQKKAAAAAEK